jgi:hypothetical protein
MSQLKLEIEKKRTRWRFLLEIFFSYFCAKKLKNVQRSKKKFRNKEQKKCLHVFVYSQPRDMVNEGTPKYGEI